MKVIGSLRVVSDRTIELTWDDGTASIVDFTPIIEQGGVFAPLAAAAFFERAALDERGRVVIWPGELEFCADGLFEMGRVLTAH